MAKKKQRIRHKFYIKLRKLNTNILNILQQSHGKETMCRRHCFAKRSFTQNIKEEKTPNSSSHWMNT